MKRNRALIQDGLRFIRRFCQVVFPASVGTPDLQGPCNTFFELTYPRKSPLEAITLTRTSHLTKQVLICTSHLAYFHTALLKKKKEAESGSCFRLLV